mgnify:CR=1 FL=1
MAFRGKIVPLMPTKGIDTSAGPESISDANVVEAQNFRFRNRDWEQRGGYVGHLAEAVAAAAVTGIAQVSVPIICTGTNIYKESAGHWASVKGALTLDGDGTNLNSFCELNNLLIGTNGKNPIWKYSVATDPAVVIGGTPPATAVALLTFYNRVLALAADGTLSWCAINNPDDWTSATAGSNAPALATGQTGTGLGAVGEDAFLFMSGSIWKFVYTGDSKAPFVFRVHDAVTGASGRQAIVSVPDRAMIFFANYQGIYIMQAPGYVPVRISKALDGAGGLWESVNKSRLGYISAARNPVKNEIWFSVSLSSGSTNSKILVYDYDEQTWTSFTGILASSLGNHTDGNGAVR